MLLTKQIRTKWKTRKLKGGKMTLTNCINDYSEHICFHRKQFRNTKMTSASLFLKVKKIVS